MRRVWYVVRIGNNTTVKFAVEEIVRYISMIDEDLDVKIQEAYGYDSSLSNVIWVGNDSAFSDLIPAVEDHILDDAIYVQIKNGCGVITGSNERSILLAVYRFLQSIGCHWGRPGKRGEYIPQKCLYDIDVRLIEKPSYRYRGLSTGGASSYENIADMIDWLPKAGLNSYYIAYFTSYSTFKIWYAHEKNPFCEKEPFNIEQSKEFLGRMVVELKKRGLLYHAVGHGWTLKILDIEETDYENADYIIPKDKAQYLAQINGKRDLHGTIPFFTNLCYSNPKVRDMLTDCIVQYLKDNPDVDILHFWLGDGVNNHCECENCKGTIPSDYYVMMLNDLDMKLTKAGVFTKIVFLIYVDLLWPPEKEREINNPDRFILMFAPFHRTYSSSFKNVEDTDVIPEYSRNRLKFPVDINENIAFLKAWKEIFKGDSFDFDYHFYWEQYRDPGQFSIAKTVCDDIKNFREIGLNGLINCSAQRTFFPTGFPMYVMKETLWNRDIDIQSLANEFFKNEFGKDGIKCKEYLEEISNLFDPPYIRGEKPQICHEAANKFRNISKTIEGFMPLIKDNIKKESNSRKMSWEYMEIHAIICIKLASALQAKAEGDKIRALTRWGELREYIQKNEEAIQPVFDLFLFIDVIDRLFEQV